MKRRHEMPFGAEFRDDGTIRFRLWAPAVASVGLCLVDPDDREVEMQAIGGGWFELVSHDARPCSRYTFRINGTENVPDPASRFQPSGVHGPSEVIDPKAFSWQDENWKGRPWDEAVVYELHVGTFTAEGTFAAAEAKLDYLSNLGVNAVEIMPVSTFPGQRNWGYDGVLPYAPAGTYGRPDDLKHFIDAAHAKNLMVLLDVVYNHFGPEGNCLPLYAPQFFTNRHHTPWGQAINFDGSDSRTVRDYFIHNALYWLEEYHFDGLRLDAVHAILDDSTPDILTELATTIRTHFHPERHIHLVLENADNAARYLRRDIDHRPRLFTAQWNDDIHHALHVLITGETDGYYADYAEDPARRLGRCLAEGFGYQGEASIYHNGEPRGEPSRDLPAECFVSFLQNHDQIGNRAFGDRILQTTNPAAVRVAMTCLLLAPSPPLLFMGEEFGASTPFLFFCDFGPDLASKVTQGRRSEFTKFAAFNSPEAQARIPDPNIESSLLASKLDWNSLEKPEHREWLQFYRDVLLCRRKEIIPRIAAINIGGAEFVVLTSKAILVRWPFGRGGALKLFANFSAHEIGITEGLSGRVLYSTAADLLEKEKKLAAFSAAWLLNE
jgi:malto-oligosyltrehalose trehalohydrolase